MENSPNGPSTGTMVAIGLLVLLVVLCCCSSIFVTYNRTGNINIFSRVGSTSDSDLAFAQGFGAAPDSSTSGLGLLDAFGVKQPCKVGPWSAWSPCSSGCGTGGQKTRTRQVTTPAKNGGSCLDPLTESTACTDNPPCETAPLVGQYEPCPSGGQLDGALCRVHGRDISESECTDLKNQAALTGFTSTGSWIGAAVGAGEVDCSALYMCPAGYRDTQVGHMCDLAAVPKCPDKYHWDSTRGVCIFSTQ